MTTCSVLHLEPVAVSAWRAFVPRGSEVCHAVVAGAGQLCGDERAGGDRTKETRSDSGTAVAGKEVADLGDDGEGTISGRFARWRPVTSSVQR